MQNLSAINGLDMSVIAARLVADGMTEESASQACEAGRQELLLLAAHVGESIVPTVIGDQAIHVLLEMPETCRQIAEAVAGPGAQIVHTQGAGGDWERSQRWRSELFGGSADAAAGCMLELKGGEAAGCMLELKRSEAAGCMLELKKADAAGCLLSLQGSDDRPTLVQ